MPEWDALVEADPRAHVFATPRWHRVWWEEFGADKDLFLIIMRRGSDVAAIVPLYRKHENGRNVFRFIGGIDLTDYLGPICSLEDRDDVADALVSWLETTDVEWDEFDGHNLPVPFGFADALAERSHAFGFEFGVVQEDVSAILELPSDWAAYEAALDSKQRHELRRKRRRIGRDHPDARIRSATEETLDADIKTFVELHRGAEGLKGHFMRPEVATFFERVARDFLPLGWLRLDLLEIAETTVASTFSFELRDRFYLYNSAYDPEFARLSPGLFLVSELVRRSIEGGLTQFDFLRGPERYKYQFGAQLMPLHNVRILRNREA